MEKDDSEAQLYAVSFSSIASFAVRAACLLGIPDAIAASPTRSLSIHQISQALRLTPPHPPHPSSARPPINDALLFRLMRLLCAYGVFSSTPATNPEVGAHVTYGLTPMSEFLVSKPSNGHSLRTFILAMTDKAVLHPVFSRTADCILDGSAGNPFESFHGGSVWELAGKDAEWNGLVNSGMEGNTRVVMEVVLQHYDGFKDVEQLVDVGGGLGMALSMILRKYPSIKGVNYDLPHVVATAPPFPGIQHTPGDMRESIPPGDAIFIRAVLHNWDDDTCIRILQNCAKVLPPNGKLIIVDVVLKEDDDSQYKRVRFLSDFVMMCTFGAKERTVEEWQRLLAGGGFNRHRIVDIPNVQVVIEAFLE